MEFNSGGDDYIRKWYHWKFGIWHIAINITLNRYALGIAVRTDFFHIIIDVIPLQLAIWKEVSIPYR